MKTPLILFCESLLVSSGLCEPHLLRMQSDYVRLFVTNSNNQSDAIDVALKRPDLTKKIWRLVRLARKAKLQSATPHPPILLSS